MGHTSGVTPKTAHKITTTKGRQGSRTCPALSSAATVNMMMLHVRGRGHVALACSRCQAAATAPTELGMRAATAIVAPGHTSQALTASAASRGYRGHSGDGEG